MRITPRLWTGTAITCAIRRPWRRDTYPIRLTSNQVLDRDTVRIISPVSHRLGIHPDVTLGDF